MINDIKRIIFRKFRVSTLIRTERYHATNDCSTIELYPPYIYFFINYKIVLKKKKYGY